MISISNFEEGGLGIIFLYINQAPHPTGGEGDKACNDDITTNKRQQPYHTSVEHTARGGANQKDQRPHSTGGEGTRPNKTRRGKQKARGGVAALHHIYTYWFRYPTLSSHLRTGLMFLVSQPAEGSTRIGRWVCWSTKSSQPQCKPKP